MTTLFSFVSSFVPMSGGFFQQAGGQAGPDIRAQ
jgi:hypothetical protein